MGITDTIEIEEITGERKNFNVEIMELSNSGFNNIAKWNASSGYHYIRSPNDVSDLLAEKWQNKTFRVVSRIGAPYLIEKKPKEGEVLIGNDRYEGYSKDLIHEILKETLNLKYEFEIVPGNGYGSYNKDTKKWDGLVGHLLDHVCLSVHSINLIISGLTEMSVGYLPVIAYLKRKHFYFALYNILARILEIVRKALNVIYL